ACVPNAGLPDEEGHYNETPAILTQKIDRFAASGWVNLVGGCCGTTPEHIRMLAAMAARHKPRLVTAPVRSIVSGIEAQVIDDSTRPLIVGERTNVLGSRKFKRLIGEGKYEEAAEIGRLQVRRGGHILDVCVQDPDRNESADMSAFLSTLVRKVKVPLMIDTTDSVVLEEALKRTPGKSIINSINLEDGEERFQRVVPIACRYGAALVVGCIDEDKQQAQAITRERKLAIAERSCQLLTAKYGVAAEDIIFDPLVFPVGTGDRNYIGSGVETIEGIRLIKQALPDCKTVLGISNVSFGLPEAGREVLNSVMLYHCVQAGLDLAIVNSEKLQRYPSISEEERRLAEDLIWWRGEDPIAAFASYFGSKKAKRTREERKSLPLDERLALYILEGSRDGLIADLDQALETQRPLEIINGPLMKGMDEVGRLFNANQMIVAEVLQSAEAMKAAVTHLEPFMEKSEGLNKGTIVLATVKGDVHDIGKNLVDIILSNNGYRIINLGIKVPPDELIKACAKHQPDAIGLSGLLVKSAQMMVVTAQDLKAAGVRCPMLVGGAALSSRFTRIKIAPEYDGVVAYANDAMQGLDLANQLMDPQRREALTVELDEQARKLALSAAKARDGSIAIVRRGTAVHYDGPIPEPPDLKPHLIRDYAVRSVEDLILANPRIKARAAYRFFPVHSDGDRAMMVYAADGKRVLETFLFGRQSADPGLCLADYVTPVASGRADYLCMMATTIADGVRDLAEKWKDRGEYLRSHILQAIALESAEAFAELLHLKIRQMWGIGDPPGLTFKDLYQAHYHGKRYSFGYPACPRLEDQAQLFRLLELEQNGLGLHLTEGYMMDPESSVSAIVLHNPEAKYFSLSPADIEALERELDQPAAQSAVS
ncbi:MAG: vitamin B12 dependent-methionine synthase activation domain-containing protein, partial [Candidatus Binataceae bacterium]